MSTDRSRRGVEDPVARLRVLVVEGDGENRPSISKLIRKRGCTVVTCETGESAWEVFQQAPFDMVVPDFTVDGLDGEALLGRIRAHPGGGAVVVLAATAEDEAEALRRTLDAGADDLMAKPVEPRSLAARLAVAERRLRRRRDRGAPRSALGGPPREPASLPDERREVVASIDVAAERLIHASPQTLGLFGIPHDRLLSDPHLWRDYFRIGVDWGELAQSPPGTALTFEYPVTVPSGDARWIRSSIGLVTDPESGALRADGVFSDATGEHEAHRVASARNEELAALHRLSELILAAASLDEAYDCIVQHVGEVLDCPVVAIELLDASGDSLSVVASRGIEPADGAEQSVPLHHTLSGIAVRTGKPLIETNPQSRDEHQAPHLVRLNLERYAAFPMAAGDEVRGTLMLGTREPGEFDERFQRIGASLATTLAVYLARLEAEAALKNSETRYRTLASQLQEANEELEAFAYSVSHDLRTPLRTMQGFAHALLQHFGDELAPRARDYASRIIAAGEQSEELIKDLLDYSRLSFEHVDLKVVDLNAVVSEVLEQAQADLQGSGARVEVRGTLPVVLANHTTLVQVLANLVGNAVKFVPGDRVPEISISAEDLGDRVRVTVEDNGIGIPPGQEERIFRVFERLSEGDARPGTGIGLAIVRRGMQRVLGTCGVKPSAAGGSAFWIVVLKERREAWAGSRGRVARSERRS